MSKRLCVVIAGISVLLVGLLPVKAARPLKTSKHVSVNPLNPESVLLAQKVLKKAGYDPNEIQRLWEARRADAVNVRSSALVVLTDRFGDEAFPALEEALDDSDLLLRMDAARLLRLMGNTRGLARMQKDYAALVPDGSSLDPNLTGLSGTALERAKQKANKRNFAAMEVARILAEFEDHRGFELAAKLALDTTEGSVYVMRIRAARVLVEIAMDDPKVLKAENRDPGPVLVTVAESEKDPRVLQRLAGDVFGCRLRNDLATHIIEKIVASPHTLDKNRPEAATYLEAIRESAVR